MRRKNILIVTTLLLSFSISFCGSDQSTPPSQKRTGELIYQQTCAVCHGLDGNGNIAGAALLTKSVLSEEACILVIKKGRGSMPANMLRDDEEIKEVVRYISTFRK